MGLKRGEKLNRYNKKVVKSGNILEIYEYEIPQVNGYKKPKKDFCYTNGSSPENQLENRRRVANRARREVRRIVNANEDNNDGNSLKFVTFTFAENITDFRIANYEWKKFRQRLERKLLIKLKYLTVIEFQKRGAIHYHCIFFNIPFINNKDLAAIWGQGFIKINKLKEIDNVGAYVCKYIGKDLQEDRLKREKCYFTSKGLYKSQEFVEISEVDQLVSSLPSECSPGWQFLYQSDYTGSVLYTQYNMKRSDIK